MTKQEEQPVAHILIVEDEAAHAEAMDAGLSRLGHKCAVVHSGRDAVDALAARPYDLIVTDLMLGGDVDGLGVLEAAKTHAPGAKVILVTAHSSVETCREALQKGAFDYIEKPLDLDELRAVVSRAANDLHQRRTIEELRRRLDERYGFEHIVGRSQAVLRILDTVRRVARADIPVLILGESGKIGRAHV